MPRTMYYMILGAVIAALLTGAGHWLILARGAITRAEMSDYVQEQSPWVRDQGRVDERLRGIKAQLTLLYTKMERMLEEQQKQRILIERRLTEEQ